MAEQNFVKIGTIKLTEDEAWKLYEQQKYIVTCSKIYQLHYSNAQQQVYGTTIYSQKGMLKRGRFRTLSGKEVNDFLGKQLVNE